MQREPFVVRLASNGNYWQAWWWDDRGRRHKRGLGSKYRISEHDARRKVEAMNAGDDGVRDRTPTLRAWCMLFIADRYERWADSTLELYESTVRLLAPLGNRLTITRDEAARWATSLGKGREAATVAMHVRRARTIFQAAVDRDLIRVNPFDRVRIHVPRKIRDVIPLTVDDVERLISMAPDPRFGALIGLCAHAGLRRGEALRLRPEDVEYDRHRIIVRPRGGITTTKASLRQVRLEPLLAVHLRRAIGRADRVVGRQPGSICTIMRETIARAGLEPWDQPFHALRRWRATTWRDEYPEHVVDAWLGHSLEVARRHYAAVPDHYFGG